MFLGTQVAARDDTDYRMFAQLGVTHVCADPPRCSPAAPRTTGRWTTSSAIATGWRASA